MAIIERRAWAVFASLCCNPAATFSSLPYTGAFRLPPRPGRIRLVMTASQHHLGRTGTVWTRLRVASAKAVLRQSLTDADMIDSRHRITCSMLIGRCP